jgi:tetratricopeptide (TPR) repeat protein
MDDDERKALIDRHLLKARSAVQNRKTTRAVNQYEKALELDVDQPEAWEFIAEHISSNSYDAVLERMDRALQIRPGHIPYLIAKAKLLLKKARTVPWNDYVEAVNVAHQILDHALSLEPNNLDVLLTIANNYHLRSDASDEAPIELYKKIATSTPDDSELLFKVANELRHMDTGAVLICLDRIFSLDLDSPELWQRLASEYARIDQPDKVVQSLDKIVALDPVDPRIWFDIAAWYAQIGQMLKHDICLEKCRALAGDDKILWTDIYHQLKRVGRNKAAEAIPANKLTFTIELSLKDFIHTGGLGPIHLGMTRQEVLAILGEPESWGGSYPGIELPPGQVSAPIWLYGAIELYFGHVQHRLYMIFTDHMDAVGKSGYAIRLDGWLFEKYPLDVKRMRTALFEEGIAFTEVDRNGFFGELVLENDVEIAYEYDEEYKDQVSALHITDDTYNDYAQLVN